MVQVLDTANRPTIPRLGAESEDVFFMSYLFIYFVPKTGTRLITMRALVAMYGSKIALHHTMG